MQTKTTKRRSSKNALGPGVHLGVVDLEAGGSYRVRLADGAHVRARLDAGLRASFVSECMRTGESVALVDGTHGPVIVGALYRPREAAAEDLHAVRAKRVELEAADEIVLRVGETTLTLNKKGEIQIRGRTFVVDAAALARFLSDRVELP